MATVPTRSGSPRQLTTKQTGDAWEAQARRWLEGKGLRFVAALHKRQPLFAVRIYAASL